VPTTPLVSVLLAVHDGEHTLRAAVDSILRQTVSALELVVVDDGSRDRTPDLLASIADPRLVVLRNEERRGLAVSLDAGLEAARGRYLARLDADDVALPRRLERQLARLRSASGVAIVGSAVCGLSADGVPGRVHRMPETRAAVRWHLLFGAPFFHPTVLLDRERVDRAELRYDPRFAESEDYDLWSRLLVGASGENLPEPLVLYREHPGQASRRRRDLQRSFQREVALREIARVAPALPAKEAELAWRLGAGEELPPARLEAAGDALLALVEAFAAQGREERAAAHTAAARALLRAGLVRRALALDPGLPLRAGARRGTRLARERLVRREAAGWLRRLTRAEGTPARPLRVAAVFPEPTPYRAPLLDRLAALPELELTVVYAARTVADRAWAVSPRHRAVFLRGIALPGARALLRHDYPLTPGIASALRAARPEVVVVSGWSTFAAQAAIAWCRLRQIPYLLVVESHDEGPRAGWRRVVKGSVVPRVVRGAAGVLVTGTLARRSMVARGAAPERVRVFANTIDVPAFRDRAERLAPRRDELRRALGLGPEEIAVLCVARLVPEKDLHTLLRAVAAAGDERLALVLVGEGPERVRLEELGRELGVRLSLAGNLPWERIVEAYVAADVFALLSTWEPWGVVVNEAAACGLPLVLSDQVGAAADLLRDGENGFLVPTGDVAAAAEALGRLAADPGLRRAFGERSRELVAGWGYEPSVEAFVTAVREAAGALASVS